MKNSFLSILFFVLITIFSACSFNLLESGSGESVVEESGINDEEKMVVETNKQTSNMMGSGVLEETIETDDTILSKHCKQLSLFSEYPWFQDVQNAFWQQNPDFPYDDSKVNGKNIVIENKRLQGCYLPEEDYFIFFMGGYLRTYMPIYRYTISTSLLEESPESNLYNIYKFNLIDGDFIYFSGGSSSGDCGNSQSGKYNFKENSVNIYSRCSRCVGSPWKCNDYEVKFYDNKDNTASILKYKNKYINTHTYQQLNQNYSKDKYQAYYKYIAIQDSDVESFEVINDLYSKDKNNVYYQYQKIDSANPQTFTIFQSIYAKDDKNLYC